MEIIKHSPSKEGDFMCGCHFRNSDEYALVCSNDGGIMVEIVILVRLWDVYLKSWIKSKAIATKSEVELESLKYLLQYAGHILEQTKKAVNSCKPDEDKITLNPNETRDWFCWLHRHIIYIKKESI